LDCHIPKDQATDESRGIAFIRFADFASCEKALHLMEGQVIAGTATHCNTLQHTATHCNTLHLMEWQVIAGTARHCNTLQHTATHCI